MWQVEGRKVVTSGQYHEEAHGSWGGGGGEHQRALSRATQRNRRRWVSSEGTDEIRAVSAAQRLKGQVGLGRGPNGR